jgi:hypothetical protein
MRGLTVSLEKKLCNAWRINVRYYTTLPLLTTSCVDEPGRASLAVGKYRETCSLRGGTDSEVARKPLAESGSRLRLLVSRDELHKTKATAVVRGVTQGVGCRCVDVGHGGDDG